MNKRINDLTQPQIIVDSLTKALPKLKLIYLFGSHANGTANATSDIDIAILAPHPIDNVQRFQLAQSLAIKLDCDVDLVDLLNASTVMQMQVVSTGRLLHGEPYFDQAFSSQIYSMYGRLQEDRKDIISDFLKG